MKREIFLIIVAISLLFTSYTYSQSIIHPNRVGFGYAYSYAKVEGNLVMGNSVYLSTGNIDLVLNFYNIDADGKNIQYSSGSIYYTVIKPGRKIYPSFNIGYIGGDNGFLTFGISVAGEIFHLKDLRIIPEGGAEFAYSSLGGSRPQGSQKTIINIAGNASLCSDINISWGGSTVPFIFTLAPGFQITSPSSYFAISATISFVP